MTGLPRTASSYAAFDRPPLDAGELRRALVVGDGPAADVIVVESTGSTNADLLELAESGAPAGTVYAAEYQNAGRGRLDRGWDTPARSGLMFSVLLRPTGVPPRSWTWLPLLAGCAVHQTVRDVARVPAALKWPNDVLVDDRKLCGILVQRADTPEGPAAVVGIGLNVSMTADELPTATATSLAVEGAAETDRDRLLRGIVRNLIALHDAWCDQGGDPEVGLRAAYVGRCATVGRQVRIHLGEDKVAEGTAIDVDGDGRLVVDHGGESTAYGAGDVVHVR